MCVFVCNVVNTLIHCRSLLSAATAAAAVVFVATAVEYIVNSFVNTTSALL